MKQRIVSLQDLVLIFLITRNQIPPVNFNYHFTFCKKKSNFQENRHALKSSTRLLQLSYNSAHVSKVITFVYFITLVVTYLKILHKVTHRKWPGILSDAVIFLHENNCIILLTKNKTGG